MIRNVIFLVFMISTLGNYFYCSPKTFDENFTKLTPSKQAELYGKMYLLFLNNGKYAQAYMLLSKAGKKVTLYESFLGDMQFLYKKSGGVTRRSCEEFFKDYSPGIPSEGKVHWYAKCHLETKNYPLVDELITVIREAGEYRIQSYKYQKSNANKSSLASMSLNKEQERILKKLVAGIDEDLLANSGGKKNKYNVLFEKIDKANNDELMPGAEEILQDFVNRKYTDKLKKFDNDGFLTRIYKSDIKGFSYKGRYSLGKVIPGGKYTEILVYDLIINQGVLNLEDKNKRIDLSMYFYFKGSDLNNFGFMGFTLEDNYSYHFIYYE